MSTWFGANPETESNTQKQDQSLLRLSQECRGALWVLSMDSSGPQTSLYTQDSYPISPKETTERHGAWRNRETAETL